MAAGGFVDFGRVNGNLALSRAIGDFERAGLDACERGNIERPREDGDVRGRAAAHGGEANDTAAVHRGGFGR